MTRVSPQVELVLYISGASPASARALANLRRILRRYRRGTVALDVRDLNADPWSGERDQITFTPTLCKRAPDPPMWILGDLSRPEPLVDLLEFYGVEPTHEHSEAHHRHSRL